ncbi:MAG: acyl transferase [Chitinophagaceae bacterium]|nr:MAG: acyl transferase [Chitinophagaceae bacterium]
MDRQWNDKIFGVTDQGFEGLALRLFEWQYSGNGIYRQFCDALGRRPGNVASIPEIPFLPVRFFKSFDITTGSFTPDVVFESSGTTGMLNSRHLVKDITIYEESFMKAFTRVYGPVEDLVIIGLLPSYLERGNSSLVYMVDRLVRASGRKESGFYLDNMAELAQTLRGLEAGGQRSLLIGVTFALLDFAASFPMPLRFCQVMETGGMKGRRREMVRAEVQDILKQAFSLETVHSEYGMTELLSQAYSTGGGLFRCPPWMKVVLREEEDPLAIRVAGQEGGRSGTFTGAVNIIDLANIHSCNFIATDDAARLHGDGSFEILGRLDHSDLRGCSLLSL